MEERVVSNDEAPGSKPGFSIPDFFIFILKKKIDPVAQRIRRETTNLKIAGSNPARDELFFFSIFFFSLQFYFIMIHYENKNEIKITLNYVKIFFLLCFCVCKHYWILLKSL